MEFIDALVRNPVKTWVAVLLVSLFGLIAIFRMPMQLTPEVQTPAITIETRWPGASPQEVEREIVQEQEEQLKSVEGLVKMSSECLDSSGKITLEFAVGQDMQSALVTVNSRLQQVPEYPEDADEPVIQTSNAADRPIAWFILGRRPPTPEKLSAFAAEHPELADDIARVQQAQSVGLKLLLIRELIQKCSLAHELLGEQTDPATVRREQVQTLSDRSRLAKQFLAPALASQDLPGELRKLVKYAQNAGVVVALQPPQQDIETERRFAEDNIEARFERVGGVSNANVFGGRDPELQVVVDPVKLAASQLTIADVRAVLRGQNQDTSGGDFWEGKRRYVIRTLGQFDNLKQVEEQLLAVRDGRAVFVRDVAEVRLDYKKPDGVVRRYGAACIAVNCLRTTGANVLDVQAGLEEATRELNDGILATKNLELTQVYDETEYIHAAIGLVNDNIIWGSILTIAILYLFLKSWKSTFVIAISIPISIVATFLVLNMLGRSLNVISLAGLAYATGVVVDNAIVVLENIYRHYQLGDKPLAATVKGTEEVWGAVLASTLMTLAVFLPVVLVKEEAGQLFLDIALSVCVSVGLSLIVAMTVIPVATNMLFDEHTEHEGSTEATRDQSWWGRWLRTIMAPFDAAGVWCTEQTTALNWRILASTPLRLLTVVLFVFGSIGLTWYFWPKVEYLPNGNRNLVFGIVLPPAGYNLDQMIEMGEEVENGLRPYWDPAPGAQLDYPAIGDFFFVARGRSVFIGTRAVDPTKAGKLVPLIQQVGSRLPGVIAVASQSSLFAQGLVAGRAIDIEITGPELEKLVQLGGPMMGQLPQIMPGSMARPIPSLDLSNPEVHVRPKLQQTGETGISSADLGYTVNALIDGAYATDYYLDGHKIDLVIMGRGDAVRHSQDVDMLPIATPTGQLVRLADVADITLSSGPEQVNRRERQRAITIQVTPPPDMALQDAIDLIQQKIVQPLEKSGQLAGGYRITLGGTADKLQATWVALRGNIILAGLITYLLMAALFESWLYPAVIILTVPLGAVGGILGMQLLNVWLGWLGDVPQTLDVLTMLGFVILIGTVVNNPILIVHQSLIYMREEGMDPVTAIVETVRTRLRPIFSTAVTTVIGLIPLVFFPGAGSELYRGLGAVVLGGIALSTIFTLFLVPALFSLFIDVFGAGQMEPKLVADLAPALPAAPGHEPPAPGRNGDHAPEIISAESDIFRPTAPR